MIGPIVTRVAILLVMGAVCLPAQETTHEILIPGGRDALAFYARGKPGSAPERFLTDYCRAIVENTSLGNARANTAYLERLQQYFRRLAALEALGVRAGSRVTLTLAFDKGRGHGPTEQILNLLGWKMREMDKRAKLQADEKTATGRRQESAAALSVDGVAMQQAFEEGKPFSFEVLHEPAPILLDEATWRREFYAKDNPAGGFAEALARDPRLARAYAGLSVLDKATVSALIGAVGLKELVEKHGSLLYRYSSALLVEKGKVAVPGGAGAEVNWEKLVGTSPAQTERFLKALVENQDGHMLAFFFNLSQFDREHQRFSTASGKRLESVYELFRHDIDSHLGAASQVHTSPLIELLREIRLDATGKVRFPGGVQIWSHGQAAAPDDDIIQRLARSSYKREQTSHSELEPLLAVMQIDATRAEPLDGASAALLARQYPEAADAYPYFMILTGLGQREFELFFGLVDKMRHYPAVELNAAIGQLHSLIELLCLSQESGALDEKQATALFGGLCEGLAKAGSAADFAGASLDFIRQLTNSRGNNPDEAVRDLLLGRAAPVTFALAGVPYRVDVTALQRARYQRVLEVQKVPSLAVLLDLRDSAEHLKNVEALSSRLPYVAIPNVKLQATERHILEASDPRRIARMAAKVQGDPHKLAHQVLAAMSPQVTLALSGIVYAYFLGPDDLLVSEDPLLLRKHQFVEIGVLKGKLERLFPPTDLELNNESAGSYVTGGFSEFGAIAGRLAAAGGHSGSGGMVVDAQMAALRNASRRPPGDEDFRLLGLKIRIAREWINESAKEPALASDLAEATAGLLSQSRRGALLEGVRAGNWPAVWQAVTLSDLYRIGGEYRKRYQADPWRSPAATALRQAPAEKNRDVWFGVRSLAPYEDSERYLDPVRTAERAAEFQFYLADWMDRAGVPAAVFCVIAEPLARTVFERLQMADSRDWRSVLTAFQQINTQMIQEALVKP